MDFTKEELNKITSGADNSWSRIGDPSAFGGIYESPNHPGKVVKIQTGNFSTYDNEINKQFEASLQAGMQNNDVNYEVPRLGTTGFIPNNSNPFRDPDSGKLDSETVGTSFIEMDRANFSEIGNPNNSQSKLAKAKGLIDLYREGGIIHRDRHEGNIKFNPESNKAVVLDYASGVDNKDISNRNIPSNSFRSQSVRDGLYASGNMDMLELFDESYQNALGNRDKTAIEDIIKQGEDVVKMTSRDIDPVNFTERNSGYQRAGLDPVEVDSVGPSKWNTQPPSNASLDTKPNVTSTSPTRFASDVFANKPALNRGVKGLKAGLNVGLTDLIPSAEVVRTASQKGLKEGAQQFAQEAAMGIPTGAAVGATIAAVPALAPFVPGVGGGMMLTEGARTLNEATRATTGESLLSKARQTLGTAARTGNSSPNNSVQEQNRRRMDRVKNPPQIKPATSVPTSIKDLPMPELGRRVRMASERFNPAKLEFGITELLFGR